MWWLFTHYSIVIQYTIYKIQLKTYYMKCEYSILTAKSLIVIFLHNNIVMHLHAVHVAQINTVFKAKLGIGRTAGRKARVYVCVLDFTHLFQFK